MPQESTNDKAALISALSAAITSGGMTPVSIATAIVNMLYNGINYHVYPAQGTGERDEVLVAYGTPPGGPPG